MLEFDVPFAATDQQVCVIGTGYVGLTAGACLAFLGHTVVCTDASRPRVESLRRGEVPFLERQLPELVRDMVASGRLRFSTDNVAAAAGSEFVFLCLPTPQGADGSADLTAVCEVATEIGPHLVDGATVINKSTVPVGTARLVADALGRSDVSVVSNPEFLAEGTAVANFLRPDRVVLGSDSVDAAKRVAALYERVDTQILIMDAASAETVKYAANTYLAVRLSFVNSMAAVCEAAGADVLAVMDAVGSDHRIGPSFLKPGPGWGGSCFPKDTAALIHSSRARGYDFTLLEAAVDANRRHHRWVADKIQRAVGGTLEGATVAVWGLTFKAGTDDLRDSAALAIARELTQAGAHVRAFDPTVSRPRSDMTVCTSALEACAGADVLFIGTEWPEFRDQDLLQVGRAMSARTIVDGRNLLHAEDVVAHGFHYEGVGLKALQAEPASVAELASA